MTRHDPTGPPRHRRGHRALAAGAALAMIATGLLATPAQAADRTVADGAVHWGLKETFRSYVGNQTAALPPIGALPMGERITVSAPATFDTAGTPASPSNTSNPNETLPYRLPVQGGTLTDAGHLTVATSGGFAYHFPSHFFEITVSNVQVEVSGGTGVVKADVSSVITGDFGDFKAGNYGGTGVTIAAIANPGVSVSGDQVTVNASGITLTESGREVLPLYPVGTALDDLSVTASLTTPTTPVFTPQLSVSKASGFNPDGSESVTVTGTGFDPAANASTRLPVTVGQPAGVYVVFGRFADAWRPSTGAAASVRKVISQRWAMPAASLAQVSTDYPSQAPALVELAADGSFSATLQVSPDDSVAGNYGIYTYAAGGSTNAAQELFVPIAFATAGGGDTGGLDVDVTVPTRPVDPEPGEFVWRIDGGATAVSLGTAAVSGDHFAASGQLAPVVVTDTRAAAPAWSISAQVTDFTGSAGSFDGKHLGWTPAVTSAGGGATAGAAVGSGFVSGSGLKDSRTLGSAPAGHVTGSATLGAGLTLQLPLDTAAGDYQGTLTLTAVS